MRKPIEKFTSQERLNESLKEWQARLFLNDWTIKAKITTDLKDESNHGECESCFVSKCAMIRIQSYDAIKAGEWIQKQPQELVLVHELLHCKMALISRESTLEGAWWYETQHQLLEEMAKALIMAKYGLDFDWFITE